MVAATGIGMIFVALLGVVTPERLRSFLRAFAGSARAHYLELLLRVIAGASFIIHAEKMIPPAVFRIFGWVILITSAVLLFIPWQSHRRFAGWVIPVVIRYLPLYALASFALGVFILYGVIRPAF